MKKFFWIFVAVLTATCVSGPLWADVRINEFLADNEGTIEDPDEPGEYPDWIELYNPGPTAVDLAGYYLTDDLADPTQFQIQTGVAVGAGGYVLFWADGDTEQGMYHTSFKLSKSGEAIGLYDPDGTTVVDSYVFGSQSSDVSEGRSPDGADNWVFFDPPSPGEANPAPSSPIPPPSSTPTPVYPTPSPVITPVPTLTPAWATIKINEFMADNETTIEDPDDPGEYPDWIELYNPGSTAVDLAGYYLTDDLADPTQFQIQTGVAIEAGGYVLFWADEDTEQGIYHTNFKLSKSGEEIGLYAPDGAFEVDGYIFGEQSADISEGRLPDGADDWIFYNLPSPGRANSTSYLRFDSGDYNGDGTSEIAVFRRSSGLWAVRGVTRTYFGTSSDLPVSGDYSGDGTTTIGIFRPSSGLWAIRGVTRIYFGVASDLPVSGDYNGDGTCEVGIFRAGSGLWAVKGTTRVYFGASGDLPVPGDYEGGGSKNIGVFRGDTGLWAIKGVTRAYFGSSSDMAVPGDYGGNGSWEVGIFRPSVGLWAIRGLTRSYFGSVSDQPVPADYSGTGADDIGVFRGSSGLWAIRGLSRAYFGTSGDIPVTR